MAVEEAWAVTSREFSAYRIPLEMVFFIKYLGIVLSAADDDWPVVIRNLTKARAVWRRMSRILSREGKRLRVSDFTLNLLSSRC